MILVDQCVPNRYYHFLRELGYDADLMTNHMPDDAIDKDIIAVATQLDRIFLTTDVDFSNILDYPPKSHQGVIVLRYRFKEEAELGDALKTVLTQFSRDDLRGTLVIISKGQYRTRR
ncbi:MAG: DUF5615 family PIN-like protein [bacterium]|nr:DUF5615 family PIN-like protein [bacterium]